MAGTTITETIWENIKHKLPRTAIVATVTDRQYPTPTGWALPDRFPRGYWCDVQPEKTKESILEHVPMNFRVMNYADALGLILVPKMGTEVVVDWVDDRPTITACQEWDFFILKKGPEFYLIVDDKNNVELKTTGTIKSETSKTTTLKSSLSHQADAPHITLGAVGLEPAMKGNSWLAVFTPHTHLVPTTPTPWGFLSGPPMNAAAAVAALSTVVVLD